MRLHSFFMKRSSAKSKKNTILIKTGHYYCYRVKRKIRNSQAFTFYAN